MFVQAEDEPASGVRTWGAQHAKLWARLAETGCAVEAVVVGRDVERLAGAWRLIDRWASTPAAADAESEAGVAAMHAIRRAITTYDSTAPESYGDISGALRCMAILSTAVTGRPATTAGRIWRSERVPQSPAC